MKGITKVLGGKMRNHSSDSETGSGWLKVTSARHRKTGTFSGQQCSPSPGKLTTPSCLHWPLCSSPSALPWAPDVHALTHLCSLASSHSHALPLSPTVSHPPKPSSNAASSRKLSPNACPDAPLSHPSALSELVRIIPVHVPQEGRDSSHTPSYLQEHPA